MLGMRLGVVEDCGAAYDVGDARVGGEVGFWGEGVRRGEEFGGDGVGDASGGSGCIFGLLLVGFSLVVVGLTNSIQS